MLPVSFFKNYGAIGEICNFYNFPPRMLIFGTHIPPVVTMHAAKFH